MRLLPYAVNQPQPATSVSLSGVFLFSYSPYDVPEGPTTFSTSGTLPPGTYTLFSEAREAWSAPDNDHEDVYCNAQFVLDLTLGNPCRADFNGDGVVDSPDFFDFLNAFFVSDPAADINDDTLINSADFFDFLTAFFAGC